MIFAGAIVVISSLLSVTSGLTAQEKRAKVIGSARAESALSNEHRFDEIVSRSEALQQMISKGYFGAMAQVDPTGAEFSALNKPAAGSTFAANGNYLMAQLAHLENAIPNLALKQRFRQAFHENMANGAQRVVPPRDTSFNKDHVRYESALRKQLLEDTTRLVHAIEVAKRSGVIPNTSLKTASEEQSVEVARNMVQRLAQKLIETSGKLKKWWNTTMRICLMYASSIIESVQLLASDDPLQQVAGIAQLTTNVGALLYELVNREVSTAEHVDEALEESGFKDYLQDLQVSLQVAPPAEPAPSPAKMMDDFLNFDSDVTLEDMDKAGIFDDQFVPDNAVADDDDTIPEM